MKKRFSVGLPLLPPSKHPSFSWGSWLRPLGTASEHMVVTVHQNGCIHPCIPNRAAKPPAGLDWVHEIKQDGYRLIVRRDGDTVRLFTRRGYDWCDRYPAIARQPRSWQPRRCAVSAREPSRDRMPLIRWRNEMEAVAFHVSRGFCRTVGSRALHTLRSRDG
jgi:hypothetical protein